VSGIVFEHTAAGPRPAASVPLVVRSWAALPVFVSVTSDGNGRYEARGLPGSGVNITIAPPLDSAYRAPCPTGTSGLTADATIDVHVVSTAVLANTGTPRSLPTSAVTFSGIVFERSLAGRAIPIGGASVQLTAVEQESNVESATLTDKAGRYLLCAAPLGAGGDQEGWLHASHEGFESVSRRAFPETSTDIVLTRK
jgi:hypothetical protein